MAPWKQKATPAVASPNIMFRLSGVEGVAPAGKEPVEYCLSSSSESHSCPTVILWVMALVLASYVVVLPVEDWSAAAREVPV